MEASGRQQMGLFLIARGEGWKYRVIEPQGAQYLGL